MAAEISLSVVFNGVGVDANFKYAYLPKSAIVEIQPSFGDTGGGTMVSIIGRNFASGPAVRCRLRQLSAEGFSQDVDARWITSSLITCITVVHPQPCTTLIDVSSNGIDFTTDGIEFAIIQRAIVLSIFPHTGPSSSETMVTVRGLNFVSSPLLACSRTFESQAALVSSSLISCRMSPKGTSNTTIQISNNGQDFSSSSFLFQFTDNPAVSVLSLTPSVGPIKGGGWITAWGLGLSSIHSIKCRFGSQASEVRSIGSSKFECKVPPL